MTQDEKFTAVKSLEKIIDYSNTSDATFSAKWIIDSIVELAEIQKAIIEDTLPRQYDYPLGWNVNCPCKEHRGSLVNER